METERRIDPEQRHSQEDLQQGKEHLELLLAELQPFIQMGDEGKNEIATQVAEDLKNVTDAIEMKVQVKRVQELLNEASNTVLRRQSDQEKLNEIHKELILIEKGLE